MNYSEITRSYENCTIYETEYATLLVKSPNGKCVAIFDCYYGDNYTVSKNFDDIGKPMSEILEEYGTCKKVYQPQCEKCIHCGQCKDTDVECCNICDNHLNYEGKPTKQHYIALFDNNVTDDIIIKHYHESEINIDKVWESAYHYSCTCSATSQGNFEIFKGVM